MSHHLVYVIGPSGAARTVSSKACARPGRRPPAAHWSRRTITRPVQAGGEQHEAVDAHTFGQLCQDYAFAMQWQANGLYYGVRHIELQPLHMGRWVFVNGSRAWLPQLLQQWPQATVVHIGAALRCWPIAWPRGARIGRGRGRPAGAPGCPGSASSRHPH